MLAQLALASALSGFQDPAAPPTAIFYEQYLKAHPGDAAVALKLASLYIEGKQAARAAALVDAMKPKSPAQQRLSALAHRAAATDIYDSLPDGSPAKHALTALFRVEAGLDREAFQHYRKALEDEPAFPGARAAIAEIYQRTSHPDWAEIEAQREKGLPAEGRYKEALDHLRAAQPVVEDSWEKLDLQARAAQRRRSYGEAVALWRRALTLSPGNEAVEAELARGLWQSGESGEAAPLLERHEMWFELAAAQLELGEEEKALASIRNKIGVADVETAKLHGRILIELNRPAAALPMLQAVASRDVDGGLHQLLGRAYQALHMPNPAGLAMRKADELRRRRGIEAGAAITPP